MPETMTIEIWSDITCPYCYIGKHRLQRALERFPGKDKVEIEWRSFELDPDAPVDTEEDIYDKLASKYGRSREWAVQANEELRQQAAGLGLSLNPDKIIPTNSFDAHRLVKLAAEEGRAGEAQELLFSAYFSEGRHIARPETLKQIGTEIGIEPEEMEQLLAGDDFAEQVRADEQEASKIGMRGVPFFLFNRQYAIPGALPVDSFLETLEKVREAGDSRPVK